MTEEFASYLRGFDLVRSLSGGSGAATVLAERDGRRRFVKYVPYRRDAVDGHEAGRLLVKHRQVELIHRFATEFAAHVPKVWAKKLEHGCVLESDFIEGCTPVDILLAGGGEAFGTVLARMFDALGHLAYDRRSSIPKSPQAPYLGRLSRRLAYIASMARSASTPPPSPSAALDAPALLALAHKIASERGLYPSRLFFPAHGDLNLFNVIVKPGDGGFAFVDQRGTLDDWDPVYDIGKILMTVWLQAPLELGLVDGRSPDVVRARRLFACGAREVRERVAGWGFRDTLGADPGHLWERVLFAAAIHAICESAARLSVARAPTCTNIECEYVKSFRYMRAGRTLLLLLRGSREPELPWPWDEEGPTT